MRTAPCSRLLLHLFLLTFTSITCTPADSDFLLKNVTLHVKPANTVERGAALTLTCVAKVIRSGSRLPLLKFSFFKDYDNHNTVHLLETDTNEQVTYTITEARASNSGVYQCDVTVKNQRKESSPESVTVTGLQTPVLSVDKSHVTEGDAVMVTCSAKEETGALTFTISEGSGIIYFGTTTSGEVQRNHSLMSARTAKLSCSYSINVMEQSLKSNISNAVSVAVGELTFRANITILPSTEVIEGDSVHITCRVTGTHHGSALLSLYKGSVLLLKTSSPDQKPEFRAVVLAADSGLYGCSATMNNIDRSDYANLTVKELFSTPALTITPAEAFERRQFSVTCTSSEFASERIQHHDVKYSIYRNNQTLTSDNGTHITTAGTHTNGNYTCTARVNDIVKWSRSVFFTAKVLVSKPTIITVPREVVVGQTFQIECYSDRGSFPVTYTLKQNSTRLNHVKVSRPFQKATFTALIKSKKEIGEFRCEAQNNGIDSAQTSDALNTSVTVPVGKPTLMVFPEDDEISEDTDVYISCSVINGTPPITFKWYQGENRSPVHTTTVLNNLSTHRLPSVSSVHSGEYYCEALNGAGNVEMSNRIIVTVTMARWKKGLIIAACLLCVTALALAIAIRYRAKRVKVADSKRAEIWSERPPILDINEVVDVPEEPNVEYTEVLHPQTADPARVPLRKGTDTVYSEVQSSPPDFCEEC